MRLKGNTNMIKKLAVVVLAFAAIFALAACGGTKGTAILGNDAKSINGDVGRLQKAEPLPRLLDSADLRIQNYYYTAEADPNKIWYLEVLSMTGSVISTHTIRGPVENVSDQVTNPEQQVCAGGSGGERNCDTVGLAEPNGIYPGVSDDHIAILASGGILRFGAFFETSDQPFTVHTPTAITINATAPITATDTSKTVGGKIPPRGTTH